MTESVIALLQEGLRRKAYVYGDGVDLKRWMQGMNRPRQAVLVAAIRSLLNLELDDLVRQGHTWRLEKGTSPKIFVIARDQARLYCCMVGPDIVVVDWDKKKQQRANPMILKRAQRRAQEVIDERS